MRLWCTVTSHPSVAIGPTSIVNGNKRPNAGCEQCADDVTCLCKATLTVGRTGGEGRYTGNLQIPLENLALRFRGASRVKSSLMYAQMLPPCTCAQYARLRAAPDYHSFVPRIPGSYPSYVFNVLYVRRAARRDEETRLYTRELRALLDARKVTRYWRNACYISFDS